MGQSNHFTLLVFGSIACLLGLFFWVVQRMPLVPKPPPPVTMDAGSLAAFAAKQAAFHNDKARFSVHQGIVQIEIHNVIPPSYKPLESLAVAIGRYPKASRFQVRWHGYWGRHGSITRVLYDRRKHLLFYTCDVDEVPWGGYEDRSVFRGVTDLVLRKDARGRHNHTLTLGFESVQQRAATGDLDVVFADLPKYGCQREAVHPAVYNALHRTPVIGLSWVLGQIPGTGEFCQ